MKKIRPVKVLIIFIWLALWQLLSYAVHNSILLVGPFEMVKALASLVGRSEYWASIGFSLLRIVGGFLAGSLAGILLAVAAVRFSAVEMFFSPVISVIKAIPVASFVILALIWFGNAGLSFLISMLIVFPFMYSNCLNGLKAADREMIEMAQVFHMPLVNRVRYVYYPTLFPFLKSAFQTAVGLSFKSGAAAEVIGQPAMSIGNNIYRAKIFLETDYVMAWTATIIILAVLTEKLVVGIFNLTDPARALRSEASDGRKESEGL